MFKYNLNDEVYVLFYGKITKGQIVSRLFVENNRNKEDWMNIFGNERVSYAVNCKTKRIGDTREYFENDVFLSKEDLIDFLSDEDAIEIVE